VLGAKVWRRLLGLCGRTVIERVEFDEEVDAVVAHVRPRRLHKRRCGRCGRPAPGYDQGEGRRRWRAPDVGELRSFLEADAPRVNCPEHGPTVIQVPWARHGAGHTRALRRHGGLAGGTHFEDGDRRVTAHRLGHDRGPGRGRRQRRGRPVRRARRVGIDEISYKRGHRYLAIVVDHDPDPAGIGGEGT
jgi:transposase